MSGEAAVNLPADPRCHHGWRGASAERITTPCPACGARSLFVGSGGHLTCSVVGGRNSGGCPSPSVQETVEKLKAELERQMERADRLDHRLYRARYLLKEYGVRPAGVERFAALIDAGYADFTEDSAVGR